MSHEQFDSTRFRNGILAVYQRTTYEIVAVNFTERLCGLSECGNEPFWVRCENVELISSTPTPP